jgi:enamine deaminase RidA (YjgF/YER057c/UK114 family)
VTIEAKESIPGLAPIVGSAMSTKATGSTIVYLSGQVGTLEDGTMAGSTLKEQTAQAFRNIMVALEANGAGPENIAKITFYVVDWDMEKLGDLMEGVLEVVDVDAPLTATTLVGVKALFEPEWLIEVDVTAVIS